jgi:hypothetical protein
MHLRSFTWVFLAAALIGSVGSANAVDCRSEKGEGYPWAWREIDGKRCWYKGNPGMDKALLRWAESPGAPAAPKRSPSSKIIVAEREPLLTSYWPPLPPADMFSERFEAARGARP